MEVEEGMQNEERKGEPRSLEQGVFAFTSIPQPHPLLLGAVPYALGHDLSGPCHWSSCLLLSGWFG